MGIREKILNAMKNSSCRVVLERFKFSKALMRSFNPPPKIEKKKLTKPPKMPKIPKTPKIPKPAKIPKQEPKVKKPKKAPKSPKLSKKLEKIYQQLEAAPELFTSEIFECPPVSPPNPPVSCSECGDLFSISCASIDPETANNFFGESKIKKAICGMCFFNIIAKD